LSKIIIETRSIAAAKTAQLVRLPVPGMVVTP
jgi:hypothetical protein